MDLHWMFLQHFNFDLVAVDVLWHYTVRQSHFGPLCHCGQTHPWAYSAKSHMSGINGVGLHNMHFILYVHEGTYPLSTFNLLKPSGFFMYHQGLTFKNSMWCSLCIECFVWISEQTATFALYIVNWLVFIAVVERVHCAVWTDSLYKADYVSSLKG